MMTTKTPSHDPQGRCYELLSPTQVLAGDNEGPIVSTVTSTSMPTIVKKKCRGNRKAQRQRQKLRRQNEQHNRMDHEMNDVVVQENIIHLATEQEQESIQSKNKRKRDVLSNEAAGPLSQSLSQLSLSQQKVAKQPKLDVIETDQHEEPLLNEKHQHTPNYLTIPDPIFIRMLSKAVDHGKQIIPWLDTKEKIDFIRQMTKATNDIRYYNLQRQLWQDHYDLSVEKGLLDMEYARSYVRQHRLCRAHNFKKSIIEQGLANVKTELDRNLELLQKCMLQLETNAEHWQPSIDHHILTSAINEFVQQGQKRLRQEFEYKKKMLEKNAQDHYLIRSFYSINPSQEQIRLAIKIWQTTADTFQIKQQQEVLRKRISLRRLPHPINTMIDRTVEKTELQLSESMMDRDQRASLGSACSKLVTQYKFDLSCLNLQVFENNRRGYHTVLTALLKELFETDWPDSIKQIIIDRKNSIVDRYEIYLGHKLNTFFVEAPMV